jgi:hypothetical protein
MEVEVIDGLASIFACVDDYAVALAEGFVARNFCRNPQEMTEERLVAFAGVRERGDVPARHHQQMDRRLRMNVGEGVTLVVLIDSGRGNASVNDLAKEAAHGETSVQELQLV